MLIGLTDILFFFFQAEDGIRDVAVTGVQTCALPISLEPQQVLTSNNLSRVTEAFGIPPLKEETSLNASLGATWRPRDNISITADRSEEHTSELQSRLHLVCRLLLEKKKKNDQKHNSN